MMHERPEVCCDRCDGEGAILPMAAFQSSDCPDCNGTGYRPATDDEWSDMSADAYSDMCEGEPPLSLDEQHRRNWQIKQGLK